MDVASVWLGVTPHHRADGEDRGSQNTLPGGPGAMSASKESPREPERTWLLSQALDGCRAQFGRNISALGDSRCWVGLKVIDGAVISRRKCRMGVSAGLLKPMLILAWGRQVHTPVLACMLPYACVQEAHADMGGQRAHLLPNLTPTFFPRGVLA